MSRASASAASPVRPGSSIRPRCTPVCQGVEHLHSRSRSPRLASERQGMRVKARASSMRPSLVSRSARLASTRASHLASRARAQRGALLEMRSRLCGSPEASARFPQSFPLSPRAAAPSPRAAHYRGELHAHAERPQIERGPSASSAPADSPQPHGRRPPTCGHEVVDFHAGARNARFSPNPQSTRCAAPRRPRAPRSRSGKRPSEAQVLSRVFLTLTSMSKRPSLHLPYEGLVAATAPRRRSRAHPRIREVRRPRRTPS